MTFFSFVHLCSATPSLLDSDDAFVIVDTKTRFVWRGSHASEFAFDVAQKVAKNMSAVASKTIVAQENMEPPTFWKILGGKKGRSVVCVK